MAKLFGQFSALMPYIDQSLRLMHILLKLAFGLLRFLV